MLADGAGRQTTVRRKTPNKKAGGVEMAGTQK
jgi:hypothetical protein